MVFLYPIIPSCDLSHKLVQYFANIVCALSYLWSMKRWFAWFFAIYFMVAGLYPYTDFAQLWHAASALKHYKLHQLEARSSGEKCTVWSFIRDHYINPESHKHSDLADHERLPAKHLHHVLDLIIQQDLLQHSEPILSPINNAIGFIHKHYSFSVNLGIDRPPSLI